jgi:uncharacterized protein YkwD
MMWQATLCVLVLLGTDTDGVKKAEALELSIAEENVVRLTNLEREKYKLPPLEVDKELMESARHHAAWMARTRQLVHTSRPVAENIAMGQRESTEVVRAWMGSSGHRANILRRHHRRIGVAVAKAPNGTLYWCQQFKP